MQKLYKIRRPWIKRSGLFVIAALLSLTQLLAQSPTKLLGGAEWVSAQSDTCYTSGKDENTRVFNTPFWKSVGQNGGKMTMAQQSEFMAMKTATIVINFGDGFDLLGADAQAARDAFRFAADIWETEVVSPVPILIDADFAPLGPGVLGQNGSPRVTNVPNAPDPSISYTLALANAIAGFDLSPGTPNGNQTYNTDFTFYFGTDGNTPGGITDFVTVVLHEIGHSMGISGISNGGVGVGGNGGANPAAWDIFVELGDGTPILDLGFGTPEQQAALISGDLFSNGPLAVAALGGTRPQIWAPNPFQGGSSYSHWDEFAFPAGDINSLMSPQVGSGESNFNVGPITRGILADQGWQLSNDLAAQDVGVVSITSPISDSDLSASETVEVTVRNFGIEGVAGFDLSYRVDGGAVVTETFSDSLPAVSVATYSFATPADLSADGTSFNIEAFSVLSGDEDTSNDTTAVTISNLIPEALVSASEIDFGSIGVGNVSTQTVTVSSVDSGPLSGEVDIESVDIVVLTSGIFTSSDELPITITPGGEIEFPFTYSPTALDADTAIATLNTNAGSFEIQLTGQGTEPSQIAVSPSELSSVLEVGQSETQSITVTNTGVADLTFALSFGPTVVVPDTAMSVAASFAGNSTLARTSNAPFKRGNKNIGLKRSSSVQFSEEADNSIYKVDDGTGENNIGINDSNELMWMNAFQTVAGAEVITTISSAVASGAAETPARFILYNDPDNDGDPTNAVYLTETSGILTNPGEDVFTTVDIEPTIVDGVFFVAVLIEEDPSVNAFPMPQDNSSGSQRSSWAISNDVVGEFDVFDLGNNSLPPLLIDDADASLAGNWLLRANGQFFSAAPLSGTIAQGEDTTIDVTFIGSAPGIVTSSIIISNNDPANSEVEVPITLEVQGVAVTASPSSLNESLQQGRTSTQTLTLSNAGVTDVTFSIAVDDLGLQPPSDSLLSARGFNPVVKRTAPYSGAIFEGSSAIVSEGGVDALGDIQYETGFEDFLLGDVNGQDGWVGQFGNWTIESSNPGDGSLHFRGFSDGLGQSLAFSPEVAIGTDPISSVSQDVAISGTGTTWEIIPQSPTAGSVNTRLRFEPDGTVSALVVDPGGSVFVPTGASTPSGYFNVRIEVVRATSEFSIYFDNELIFEGQGFAGDIEQLVILSPMETAGPTFDLDNVRIIDGASDEGTPAILPDTLAGIIPAGGSVDIDVLFDANRNFGTYRSDLVITLNDNPAIPALVVDATLNVIGDPTIAVDPTVVQEVSDFNKMSTRTVTLTNTGGNPLEYDLNVIGADIGVTAAEMNSKIDVITSAQNNLLFDARVTEKLALDNSASSMKSVESVSSKEIFITIGDVLFTENFDGGTFPPAGWTTVDNEGAGVEWGFSEDVGEANYSGSGEAATVSSDAFGTAEFDAELITPVINVAGKSNLALKYNVNYQNLAGLDFFDVDLSTDGGATWTNLLSWNEDHGAFRSLPGEAVTIPLDDAVAGASEVMIRWRYYDPNTGDFDWYAQIDDVELVENSEVWLAVDKSSGVVPVGGTEEIELTFDPTVVDPGFYVAGIIVNSNAANTPSVGVVVSMQELEAAEINVNPESLEQELVAGRSATQTLTLENTGESALDFNFAPSAFPNVGEAGTSVVSTDFDNIKGSRQVTDIAGTAYLKSPNAGVISPRESAIEDPVDFSDVLYATNFETFGLGDILNQQGWFGQFVNWVISTDNAGGGSQHIRSVSDGLGQTLAFSPLVPIGSEAISSVSMLVDLQDTAVTWQIIPQSPTSGSVITRLSFNPDGGVSALVADNGGEFQLVASSAPEGYFEVKIEVERATNIFTVYFDDVEVFTGEGFAGDIEQLVLLSLMEVPGPTLDIDNVQIVDGVIPDPVLSVAPISGVVPAGTSFDVDVTFNATNLLGGVYPDSLVISNNDPDNPVVVIPTTLTVIDPQVIAVDPDALSDTLSVGEMSTKVLTVSNEGVADLIFDINVVGDIVITDAAHSGIESSKDWQNDPATVEKKRIDDEKSLSINSSTSVSSVRSATVAIAYEDFEGGTFPPEGWTVVDNEGTGVVWGTTTDAGEGNYSGSGEAATVSSDAFGTAEFDTELWSPEIAVEGRTGIVLEYVVNYQNFAARDFLDVDISTDGGTSWATMLSWNEDHGAFRSTPGEIVSLQLDEFIGAAESFIVRWRYYDPNTGDFDWYAQIDDVVIGVPWLTVLNASDTIPGGSSVEVEVKFDASSLAPGMFNTSLVVCSNDLKNPQVTVPASLLVLTPPAIEVVPDTIAVTLFEGFETEASFNIGNGGQTALEYDVTSLPGFVSLTSGGIGTVEEGGSAEVGLSISAAGILPGNYWEAVEISSNDPNIPVAKVVIDLTVLEFVILDLELTAVCSDNPDLERTWEVNNPNTFDVEAFWFVVGTGVSDSITLQPGINSFNSPTQTDRPNIVKLRWLDEDDVSNDVQVESEGDACLIEDLNLTSVCSNNPDLFRRWRVRNPNPFEVMVTWNVVGTSQSGILYAAADEDTFFFTEAIGGANTTIIKWFDQDGNEKQKVKASSGEICDIDNSCAGGQVIAFNQGMKRNGNAISDKRSDANNAVGYPEQGDGFNFVSLGFGGSIDISLDAIVVDQPGNDFVVIETSFRDASKACETYPESADVYISENGTDFILVGNTCKDGSFDIAAAGLMQMQYVRIVDTSDPSQFGGNADGFDVDGIACINAHYSQATSFVMQVAENNVPDEADEAGVVTFPNPFRERIAVSVEVEADGGYELIVHDLFGAEVYRGETTSTFGQIKAEIDAKNFADGTYMLTIVAKDESMKVTHMMIKR